MTGEFIIKTFSELITPDLYIIIAAVFGICFALKKAKFFEDNFIPLMAVALGMLLELVYALSIGGNWVEALLKGVICGMAAVYCANIIKQIGGGKNG